MHKSTSFSPWIVGPRYDLLFFSTLWLPPLLLLAVSGVDLWGIGMGFFFVWIYHLLVRFPHFGAMFYTTYFRRENLAYYQRHWFAYFALPIIILLLYGFPLMTTEGFQSPFGIVLLHIAYLWGYQHIGMQNYGILQLYRQRSGKPFDAVAQRFEKIIFYAIIVAIAALNHTVPILNYFQQGSLAGSVVTYINSVFVIVLATLLTFYLARVRCTGGFTWPALLYLFVAIVVMIKWPFYEHLPAGSWFLVFNGHHSIAYLGLIF